MVLQTQDLLLHGGCFLREADQMDLLFDSGHGGILVQSLATYSVGLDSRDYISIMAILAHLLPTDTFENLVMSPPPPSLFLTITIRGAFAGLAYKFFALPI